MGVLMYLWLRLRKPVLGGNDFLAIESGATFWHLVDLLWVVLFPLFYLVS
jgi:nitric oxide reductase NorE protein